MPGTYCVITYERGHGWGDSGVGRRQSLQKILTEIRNSIKTGFEFDLFI